MELNNTAKSVLNERYLLKNESGEVIETPTEMFRRVAKHIASADLNYDKNADVKATEDTFYEMMTKLEFLPNSPTLMNAGKDLGQLSACFVLPVGDSMEEIFDSIKHAALIHKSGGGTGFSFSRIRAEGSAVRSTGGIASGPISFMKVFDSATYVVKQGGARRGANMGILRVDHPDILKFIDCKENNEDINNFNISVAITEEFMHAVESDSKYDLIDPRTKKTMNSISAKFVFNKIVDAAWRNGEPGIIFLDRMNAHNPVPSQGEFEATNPCGEQMLLPYESCNLGSINLTKMVSGRSQNTHINWDKLADTVTNAIHFLDNVIDMNKYPLEIIENTTKLTRKIGLGIMGWADMLLMLNIPYNSNEAVNLAEEVMAFITETARNESKRLAEKRGAFPLFGESIYKDGPPLRNATVTTIAPTGTLSIIAGCSSGMEPIFAYVLVRNIMDGMETVEVNPILKKVLERKDVNSDEIMKKIAENGSLQYIDEIPDDIKKVFVSTNDISPQYHVRMQAAFQKYTDNAVSKTVNFPNSASKSDVAEVYNLAFELGCKGITIYRDGSRSAQVLNVKSVKNAQAASENNAIVPRKRPETADGITRKVKIGCGNLYVTVNHDEEGICEVFTTVGKAGGCPSQSEATSKLISVALRSGVDINVLLSELRGIRCYSTLKHSGVDCTSCPDAIARTVEAEYNKIMGIQESAPEKNGLICEKCGAVMEQTEGCVVCRYCGNSHCNG